MLPTELAWIRQEGHRLDGATRRRLFGLYRPPGWLPCWFHRLWFFLAARLVRFDVILSHDEECQHLHQTLRRHRSRIQHHLPGLGVTCARLHARALQEACCCEGVDRVWLDGEVRALLDKAVPDAGARQILSRYTGKGVTIAIVDTGIYPHPDLKGRIAGFQDFVKGKPAPYDDNGHGTHVSGCAAGDGSSSGGRYRGPAPGARLVGVKVLDKMGTGLMSNMLAGINWVIENRQKYGINIMSMSLGGTPQGGAAADPLCQAVAKAWAAGIVVTVAAGNEGPGAKSVSTPGISPDVITVGAMDDRGTPDRADDGLAAFSSRGPTPDGLHKPDILSPGVNITSLRSPRSYLDKSNGVARVGQWYFTLSGTSMATPIMAGIVALLLEARPELTPDAVKARVKATAQDWRLSPDEQGAGYVDADRLVLTDESRYD